MENEILMDHHRKQSIINNKVREFFSSLTSSCFVGSCFHLNINSIFSLRFLLSSLSSCANLFNKCFCTFMSYFEQRKNDRDDGKRKDLKV